MLLSAAGGFVVEMAKVDGQAHSGKSVKPKL